MRLSISSSLVFHFWQLLTHFTSTLPLKTLGTLKIPYAKAVDRCRQWTFEWLRFRIGGMCRVIIGRWGRSFLWNDFWLRNRRQRQWAEKLNRGFCSLMGPEGFVSFPRYRLGLWKVCTAMKRWRIAGSPDSFTPS